MEESADCKAYGDTGCLLVKETPEYYTNSLFTSTVQTSDCIQQTVMILDVTGKMHQKRLQPAHSPFLSCIYICLYEAMEVDAFVVCVFKLHSSR